jgi:ribosomal protein L16 Arg81 hydroxylase
MSHSGWVGRDPLLWLLKPISLDDYLDNYWELGPLLVAGRCSGYYDELLTFEDVNEFMARNDIRYPYLRLVKNGRELPLVDYADDFVYGSNIFPGLLDNDKVFRHYSEGATLSFQIFQKCMEKLSKFCNALEARLRFQTQINIFVTPPHSKGFTAHYDDHSFFILQVSGTKDWRIYGNPVELPLQEWRRKTSTPDLGKPREITLKPGDLLYLPKGFYHEASTTDTTSVHITLGIFPYTWVQVFQELLDKVKDDVNFRRSTGEYLRVSGIPHTLQESFNHLLNAAGRIPVEPLFESLMRKAASKQIVDGRDRLSDISSIASIAPSTPIFRRSVLCKLDNVDQGVRLSFYDKVLFFPSRATDTLHHILAAEKFCVAELPRSLDEKSNQLIVAKLVKEGVLTLREP